MRKHVRCWHEERSGARMHPTKPESPSLSCRTFAWKHRSVAHRVLLSWWTLVEKKLSREPKEVVNSKVFTDVSTDGGHVGWRRNAAHRFLGGASRARLGPEQRKLDAVVSICCVSSKRHVLGGYRTARVGTTRQENGADVDVVQRHGALQKLHDRTNTCARMQS